MKALIFVLGSVALTLALTACGKPFQPPPPQFKRWQKPDASDLDIKRALLECGSLSPYYASIKDTTLNDVAIYQLCMQKNGFIFDRRTNTFCRNYPNLDACKPENFDAIPTRDTNRRLNSPFCKQSPHFDECK